MIVALTATPQSKAMIILSPEGPISSPIFASTPKTNVEIQEEKVLIIDENNNVDSNIAKNKSTLSFPLTNLDDLALDKIFSFLGDNDLRAFHQVSHACKAAVEKRKKVNERRLELVRKIKENKENLTKAQEAQDTDVSRINRAGVKPGSLLLKDCQNLLQTSAISTTSSNTPNTTTDNHSNNFLTPSFSFHSFEEPKKSVHKVPSIFHCVKCLGHVSSPIFLSPLVGGDKGFNGEMKAATRCRLTSRMGSNEDDDPSSEDLVVVLEEQEEEAGELQRKKSKSYIPLLVSPSSGLEWSVTSFSSIDTSTSPQEPLEDEERMFSFLVISENTISSHSSSPKSSLTGKTEKGNNNKHKNIKKKLRRIAKL